MNLFENYEILPQNVQDVLTKHESMDFTYENCDSLISDLESVGYTCDYGLDASPYGLRQNFKLGGKVRVAECYLNDEVTKGRNTTPMATINSEPSDDEELVAIIYDSGELDFVPQDILEMVQE